MRISGPGFHGVTDIKAEVLTSVEGDHTWLQIKVEGMDYKGEEDSPCIITFHPTEESNGQDLLVKLRNSIDGSKADE